MKKHELLRKEIKLWSIALLGIALTGQIAFTYAAYLDSSKTAASPIVTTDSSADYFASGTGTSTDPYIITTCDHLRNLQKLNLASVFTVDSYFALGNNITWTGDALLPIGSDDYPFEGQFNGKGYKITNLVVDGNNTRDVGMFGYTGFSSRVRNLILEHPTINVGSNTGGGYLSTVNYLATYFDAASQALGDLTVSGTTITVPATTLNATIDGTSVSLNLTWTSSDTDVITKASDTTFTVSQPDSSKLNSGGLYTVQLSATTSYVADGQFIKYTAERYNVEVKYLASNLSINSTYKNMWKAASSGEDADTNYHKTYVGFFIGHCDGGTAYLGLYGGNSYDTSNNGVINVNGRAGYSYGSLIGRSRTDNPADNTASSTFNEAFDFTQTGSTAYSCPTYPLTTNASMTSQNNNAVSLTNVYKTHDNTSSYCRIYPSSSSNEITYTIKNDTGEIVSSSAKSRALRLNGPLQAGTYSKPTSFKSIFVTYNKVSASNFYVNNGIWIWSTTTASSTILENLFKSDSFNINIDISYVVNSNSTNNYFKVLYNGYNPNRVYSTFTSANNTLPCTRYANWSELTSSDGYTSQPVLEYSSYNNCIQEKVLSISVNTDAGIWSNLGGWFGTDSTGQYFPCFAIGVGKDNSISHRYFKGGSEVYVTTGDSNDTVYTDLFHDYWPLGNHFESGGTLNTDYFYNTSYDVDGFTLDILSVNVSFTSSDGNSSSLNNNTDYLFSEASSYCAYDSSTDQFTKWNKESGVKVGFNMSSTSDSSSYYFYRSSGYGNGSGSTVYTSYSNASYVPFNTNGYSNASFSKV